MKTLKLRSYSTPDRAERYAATLRVRFPDNAFRVVLGSMLGTYAFRYLIRLTLPDGRVAYVGR